MKLINLLFVLFLTLLSNQAMADSKTEVIVYKPVIPAGEAKKGYCWTESLAVSRPNTWRCMIGNEIQDPCFGTDDKNIVVCGVNPLKKDQGFALQLTQPLPQSKNDQRSDQPWLFTLVGNDVVACSRYTGTMPMIDNQPVQYGCRLGYKRIAGDDTRVDVFSIDTKKSVWIAKKVTYLGSGKNIKVKKIENVAVKTVWQ